MKIPSQEELHDYTKAISVGAVKGAAVGAGISTAGLFYARKYYPAFASKGPFVRTFTFMAPILAVGITSMEAASRDFEKRTYGAELVAKEEREEQEAAKLPWAQRLQHYCINNKYKIIMSGWALSLGGSFWLVNQDKYMTKAQKAVQARMYAQGLTVAMLIASMALTTVSTSEERRRKQEAEDDEAWKKIVAVEEKRLEQQKNHSS